MSRRDSRPCHGVTHAVSHGWSHGWSHPSDKTRPDKTWFSSLQIPQQQQPRAYTDAWGQPWGQRTPDR